jgi:DNA-binding transcriptional MerR regulator
MAKSQLFIGQVAKQAGVNPKTIRYYEALELLPPPPRSRSRYRLYSPDVLEYLAFIKKAQALGFTLAEIREIFLIRQQGQLPCVHVRQLLQAKLADLERRIKTLQTLRADMNRLLASWTRQARSTKAAVCPHIEASAITVPQGKRRLLLARKGE